MTHHLSILQFVFPRKEIQLPYSGKVTLIQYHQLICRPVSVMSFSTVRSIKEQKGSLNPGKSLGSHIPFSYQAPFILLSSSLSFITLTFLKSTGHLIYKMSLNVGFLLFLYNQSQVINLGGRSSTSVLLYPSACTTSAGTNVRWSCCW